MMKPFKEPACVSNMSGFVTSSLVENCEIDLDRLFCALHFNTLHLSADLSDTNPVKVKCFLD